MAHTAPAAPFVLHRTRIGKGAMRKFTVNCQRWSEHFLKIIFNFSFGKAGINAPRLWKLRKDCLTGIGHGAMVFVAAFPFVDELYNGALLTFNIFNTSNFPANYLVFLLSE
jgi:hypothetical protein